MSLYKAGLAPVPYRGLPVAEFPVGTPSPVAAKSEKTSMATMVVAGVLSGLVLLVVAQKMAAKKPGLPAPSRDAMAFKSLVPKWQQKGVAWT